MVYGGGRLRSDTSGIHVTHVNMWRRRRVGPIPEGQNLTLESSAPLRLVCPVHL